MILLMKYAVWIFFFNVSYSINTKKFVPELLGNFGMGQLANLINTTSANAKEAAEEQLSLAASRMHDAQVINVIAEQQKLQQLTRALEDRVLIIQNFVNHLDEKTFEERQAAQIELASRKVQLYSAISRTAKLLRAAYLKAYPDRKNYPIIVVPRIPKDYSYVKANAIHAKALSDIAANKESECTLIVKAIADTKEQVMLSSDIFEQQAAGLKGLSPQERLNYDMAKIQYWQENVAKLQQQIQTLSAVHNDTVETPPLSKPKKTNKLKKFFNMS